MDKTLLVVSTNREICADTQLSIEAVQRLGAGLVLQRGTSDVALARNIALSMTMDALRKHPDRDVVLMVDDDMLFAVEAAQQVVDRVRASGGPASGVYVNTSNAIAAMPWGSSWVTGLGFLAIPRAALFALAESCAVFTFRGAQYYGFTGTSVEAERWFSEDYRLTQRLGGVELLPVEIGHIKRVPLYPSKEILRRIAAGEALPEVK